MLVFQIKPPKELLRSLNIPDIDCIQFFSYSTFATNSIDQHDLFKINNAPIYMELDDVKSNFVYVSIFLVKLKFIFNFFFFRFTLL